MIQFSRRPKFPVICDVKGVLVGAETARKLYDQLNSIELSVGEQIPLIDATAEGWVVDIEHMIVSPLPLRSTGQRRKSLNCSTRAKQHGRQVWNIQQRHCRLSDSTESSGEIVEQVLNASRQLKMDRKPRSARLPPT